MANQIILHNHIDSVARLLECGKAYELGDSHAKDIEKAASRVNMVVCAFSMPITGFRLGSCSTLDKSMRPWNAGLALLVSPVALTL